MRSCGHRCIGQTEAHSISELSLKRIACIIVCFTCYYVCMPLPSCFVCTSCFPSLYPFFLPLLFSAHCVTKLTSPSASALPPFPFPFSFLWRILSRGVISRIFYFLCYDDDVFPPFFHSFVEKHVDRRRTDCLPQQQEWERGRQFKRGRKERRGRATLNIVGRFCIDDNNFPRTQICLYRK